MKKNLVEIDCKECKARHASVFSGLNEEHVDEFSKHKSCILFKKRTIIFNEGFQPHGIYTINAGKVKVYQVTDSGKEQIVRLAKKGDVIGYRALLTGEKYSCTAETIDDSVLCFIPKNVFFGMMNKDLSITQNLLQLLSGDLKRAEHKIANLVEKPVRERLAEALLFLKETYGLEEDHSTISISLSRREIANIVGTSTESAIRLLSEFRNEGILELPGKKIKVMNLRLLRDIANMHD